MSYDESLHELGNYQELVEPAVYQGLQNRGFVIADATTRRYGPSDRSVQKPQNHVQDGDLSFETLNRMDVDDDHLYEVIPAASTNGETTC